LNAGHAGGNVTASLVHHTLLIQGDGDAGGNAIIVSQTGEHNYTVASDPANPTSINGVAAGSISEGHVKAVQIIMGAGPDSVTINGGRLKKADINLGAGANTLVVNSDRVGKINVSAGDDSDTVTINSSRVQKANINLGGGNDTLSFANTLPREKRSNLDGGAGDNTLNTPGAIIRANGPFSQHHPRYRVRSPTPALRALKDDGRRRSANRGRVPQCSRHAPTM